MKDDGEALEQSSIKETKRGKFQQGSMEMDGGLLFAHWSTARSVRGTDDPKPETLPLSSTSRDLHGTDLIYTD